MIFTNFPVFTLNLAYAREEGFSEGKQEGTSQGLMEKAVSTAKNFLKEGISPEMIAKCTGLSLDEVKSLQDKD